MKKIIYLLLALPFLMVSCNNDEQAINEETVQVSFTAGISTHIGSRSETEEPSVNKVVCAVFDAKTEKEVLRETKDITDEQIVFEPRLIKGRSYHVAFWAMKDQNYDVSNMREIKRATTDYSIDEEDYDAFTSTVTINNILHATTQSIPLTRPLAQLNIGITEEDWNAVSNSETLNQTPGTVEIPQLGYSSFDAMEGKACGEKVNRTLTATGNELIVNGQTFKTLAKCYFFPTGANQDIYITVKDNSTDKKEIRTVKVTNVPFKVNYKTNLVGSFLTGTITFNVSLDNTAFGEDENQNKEIE